MHRQVICRNCQLCWDYVKHKEAIISEIDSYFGIVIYIRAIICGHCQFNARIMSCIEKQESVKWPLILGLSIIGKAIILNCQAFVKIPVMLGLCPS